MDSLLSYDEALEQVLSSVFPVSSRETVICRDGTSALERVAREDILADDDYPRFDNSAVDGYAVGCAEDAIAGAELKIVATAAAGGVRPGKIARGEAVRILTGAEIPPYTFGIVMQEDVSKVENYATLTCSIEENENIRRRGADVRCGDVLVQAGTRLTAQSSGLLALAGIREFAAFSRPRVAILSTGDELVRFDDQPGPSMIRNTNGPMLEALLREAGAEIVASEMVVDSYDEVVASISALAERSDILLIAGGASVGDRDFIPVAVSDLGTIRFHGVRMRPGKPLLFGAVGETPVFGMPGNPSSVFVGFSIFVAPALARIGGETRNRPRWFRVRYGADHPPRGREEFARVVLQNGENGLVAMPVAEQGSFGLRSIGQADAIVRLRADVAIHQGDWCEAMLLRIP